MYVYIYSTACILPRSLYVLNHMYPPPPPTHTQRELMRVLRNVEDWSNQYLFILYIYTSPPLHLYPLPFPPQSVTAPLPPLPRGERLE